jgi:hypothetical protein
LGRFYKLSLNTKRLVETDFHPVMILLYSYSSFRSPGHVMTGATAGYDQQTVFGMNNLFSTTISGDLGQSGLANMKGKYTKV